MMLIFMYDLYCHKTARTQPIKVVLHLSYDECHPGQNNLKPKIGQGSVSLRSRSLDCKLLKKNSFFFFYIKALYLSHLITFVGS